MDTPLQIQRLSPKKRLRRIHALRQKNIEFFRRRYSHVPLAQVIEQHGTGNWEVRIDPDFLNLIDRGDGQPLHPDFLDYVQGLGHWHHSAWIDKMEMLHKRCGGEHGERLAAFLDDCYRSLDPDLVTAIRQRQAAGVISLPRLKDGRRWGGVTVFLGVFHGLHINQYLSRTQVRRAWLVEPDPAKFALSCCFIDYAELERRVGPPLMLHVGEELPDSPLDFLVHHAPVSAAVWTRMLPAYPDPVFDDIVAKIHLRWRTLTEMFVPFDREVRALGYGRTNIDARRPIITAKPELSKNSRIAVVASGPSLERDLDWLKRNRERLIILCATSTVAALLKAGIRPDFQCLLDVEIEPDWLDTLRLPPDIPAMLYYKADPKLLDYFKEVYLVTEAGKADPVRWRYALTDTHPTTGNLALAVAAHAAPAELYLVGMDFGYRDPKRGHVSGTVYDHTPDYTELAQDAPVPANFPDSQGKIFSTAYFNLARRSVEGALANYCQNTRVYNLADGAAIAGAQPKASADLGELPPYPERSADLEAFTAVFAPGGGGQWEAFALSQEELLANLHQDLTQALELPRFHWQGAVTALDGAWEQAFAAALAREAGDLRLEAWSGLIGDFLKEWYRLLLFANTPAAARAAWAVGREQLLRAVAGLREDKKTPPTLESTQKGR